MPRQHHRLLFMGDGDVGDLAAYRLADRLRTAFETSSGLQQGIRTDLDEYIVAEHEFECLVKDIAAALLGRKIKIGKRLPYP